MCFFSVYVSIFSLTFFRFQSSICIYFKLTISQSCLWTI